MQTDEPRITITGLASSGPVNVYPESAAMQYLEEMEALMAEPPANQTPAEAAARLDAIMASYARLRDTGSTVDASGLTALRVSADGQGLEPVKARPMAQLADRYWAKHGARPVEEADDGIDRSVSGQGPGYDTLRHIVGARPRPRGC